MLFQRFITADVKTIWSVFGFLSVRLQNFKGNAGQTDIAKTIGFESNEEYNEIMFLREITHTINAFNEMADVVRLYSKKPKQQNKGLQIFYQKSYTKIPNRYSKTTGVMIYLHARSISSVPIV